MFEASAPYLPATALMPPPVDVDHTLMIRFQAGDKDAFAALYERHYDAVFGVCARIVGCRGTAADVAHDTFVTAYERRHQWRPQGRAQAVRAWFTTIATRKALDQVRRASTKRERSGERAVEASVTPATPDHRCRAILEAAVRSLPPEQREVVRLKVERGLTYREIAERTGVPEPALKSRFRLARQKLTRHLEEAGVTRDVLLG